VGHDLALKTNGTVLVWGTGEYNNTKIPAAFTNAQSVSAGFYHSLVLIGDRNPLIQTSLAQPELDSTGFHISVPSDYGHVYRLEYKTDLGDTGWSALALVAGNGGMLTLTDPTATNCQRFYRVRRW
jgi:hypothetical protein